jgi:hypothetical protein
MKRVTILGTILIMLAVLVVPVMAKSPTNPNSGVTKPGQGNTTGVSSGDNNQVRDQQQEKQQTQDRNGNNGARGNSNHGEEGNGNQEQSRMRTPFYLQGEISAIDPATQTITVTLTHGNAQVKQYIGGSLTLQATEATQIFKITQGDEGEPEMGESAAPSTDNSQSESAGENGSNRVAIPFDQLAVGDVVAIHGNLVSSVFTATLITVYVRMPAGEPVGDQG